MSKYFWLICAHFIFFPWQDNASDESLAILVGSNAILR